MAHDAANFEPIDLSHTITDGADARKNYPVGCRDELGVRRNDNLDLLTELRAYVFECFGNRVEITHAIVDDGDFVHSVCFEPNWAVPDYECLIKSA